MLIISRKRQKVCNGDSTSVLYKALLQSASKSVLSVNFDSNFRLRIGIGLESFETICFDNILYIVDFDINCNDCLGLGVSIGLEQFDNIWFDNLFCLVDSESNSVLNDGIRAGQKIIQYSVLRSALNIIALLVDFISYYSLLNIYFLVVGLDILYIEYYKVVQSLNLKSAFQ